MILQKKEELANRQLRLTITVERRENSSWVIPTYRAL